jgi:hypothetical protein
MCSKKRTKLQNPNSAHVLDSRRTLLQVIHLQKPIPTSCSPTRPPINTPQPSHSARPSASLPTPLPSCLPTLIHPHPQGSCPWGKPRCRRIQPLPPARSLPGRALPARSQEGRMRRYAATASLQNLLHAGLCLPPRGHAQQHSSPSGRANGARLSWRLARQPLGRLRHRAGKRSSPSSNAGYAAGRDTAAGLSAPATVLPRSIELPEGVDAPP